MKVLFVLLLSSHKIEIDSVQFKMIFAIIAPESSSVALSYVSYLLTVIHGLYNLLCAAISSVIIFYLVDLMYGTNGMWLSFSELVLKAKKI
jgi:hypothetical protein